MNAVCKTESELEERLMAHVRNPLVSATPPSTKFPGCPTKRGGAPHNGANQYTKHCQKCGEAKRILFSGYCAICLPMKDRPKIGRMFFRRNHNFFRAYVVDMIHDYASGDHARVQDRLNRLKKHVDDYGEALSAGVITGEKRA